MTRIKITNNTDHDKAIERLIPETAVRSIEIEGLVDTGSTHLAIPEDVALRLGVPVAGTRRARDARGFVVEVPWVGGLRIEILGREMTCDALVVPGGATALIGQIPLEGLDLVVDPRSREVTVNPLSPEMPLFDLMAADHAPPAGEPRTAQSVVS